MSHTISRGINQLLKPTLDLLLTFWRPGNLNLVLLRASMTESLCLSCVRTDISGCPIRTRATVPCGFPNAPLIPVCDDREEDD